MHQTVWHHNSTYDFPPIIIFILLTIQKDRAVRILLTPTKHAKNTKKLFHLSLDPDQLFFAALAFAACERPRTPAQRERQLHGDPHSPARFRVQGALRNLPAFAGAFNCPTESRFSSGPHCRVWGWALLSGELRPVSILMVFLKKKMIVKIEMIVKK